MDCRSWLTQRRKASNMPPRSHEDIGTKDGVIILVNDPLILEHSGDPVHWLKDHVFVPDPSVTLAGALQRAFPGVAIRLEVHNCPLHAVNARTGHREYLTYVPPTEPMKYLGIPLCANLDWEPAHRALLAKLRPKLGRVKLGKRLGLPEDVFIHHWLKATGVEGSNRTRYILQREEHIRIVAYCNARDAGVS